MPTPEYARDRGSLLELETLLHLQSDLVRDGWRRWIEPKVGTRDNQHDGWLDTLCIVTTPSRHDLAPIAWGFDTQVTRVEWIPGRVAKQETTKSWDLKYEREGQKTAAKLIRHGEWVMIDQADREYACFQCGKRFSPGLCTDKFCRCKTSWDPCPTGHRCDRCKRGVYCTDCFGRHTCCKRKKVETLLDGLEFLATVPADVHVDQVDSVTSSVNYKVLRHRLRRARDGLVQEDVADFNTSGDEAVSALSNHKRFEEGLKSALKKVREIIPRVDDSNCGNTSDKLLKIMDCVDLIDEIQWKHHVEYDEHAAPDLSKALHGDSSDKPGKRQQKSFVTARER
jgi:hypothetical protein